MARKIIIGFESGSLDGEPRISNTNAALPASVGSVAIESSIVRTGSYSLKLTPASGAQGYWDCQTGITIGAPDWIRFYLRITTLPGSTRDVFGFSGVSLRLHSTGALSIWSGSGGSQQAISTALLTDTTKWYLIELKAVNNSQELKIENNVEATATLSIAGVDIRFGATDTVAATYTAYIDDFAIDDSAYPGPGNDVLLVPISDNARDTLWTGGSGGTTDLWEAVNNRPPVGTASESNTTQIEHAGGAGGTTDRYDANLTTYTNAGINSGDTINAVQPYIIHGEDASAGTKQLSFEVLSNPVVANTGAFNAGNDVGALGTFPSNWRTFKATAVNSPSVTFGTSPVMRVIRPETASRVASVCFMGMYVDYTPGPGATQYARRQRFSQRVRG